MASTVPGAPTIPGSDHPHADGGPAPERRTSAPARVSPLWWFTGPVLAVLVATMVVVGATTVPYFAFSPGSATPVEPLVTVEAKPGGPPVVDEKANGDLLFVTVSLREPTAFEALLGVLDDDVEVAPSAPYLGTQSTDENRSLNLELMTTSQDKARKVALDRLGYDVGRTARGAFLEDVDPSYPAARVLKPGATVTGADGKDVQTAADLVDAIRARRPGDKIALEVAPLGAAAPTTVMVELGERVDEPGVAVLGVSPVDRSSYTFPFEISINTEDVGGPSAGLAFTLAILDRLSPGDLLGTSRVAVTGTIELDGGVGPVGGVDHKAEAAIDEGAELFIVPPEEYELARKTAGSRLRVEQAATLDEALAVLRRAGGDPLAGRRSP